MAWISWRPVVNYLFRPVPTVSCFVQFLMCTYILLYISKLNYIKANLIGNYAEISSIDQLPTNRSAGLINLMFLAAFGYHS